jgi:hypothetical protein
VNRMRASMAFLEKKLGGDSAAWEKQLEDSLHRSAARRKSGVPGTRFLSCGPRMVRLL